MTILCYKKVIPPMRFGEKIKKTREEKQIEIKTLAKLTRIPEKYLIAIEESTFNILPKAKAHRIAYVRSIAKALLLPADECLTQFEKELGLEDTHLPHPLSGIRMFPFSSISIFLRNLTAGALVIVFAGYLVWQVKGVLQPPKLSVFSPTEGHIVSSPRITIQGETEKESRLTVNGMEIMISEQGKFAADIDLSHGVNTIEISATKKHGKTTTIIRHVVVKSTPTAGSSQTVSLK